MLAYARLRHRPRQMVRANTGLEDDIGCQPHRSWRYCGRPLTSAPSDPMMDPTNALVEKIRLRFSAVHFSASSACSTGLKGPPPCPPPPVPPAPTLEKITAQKTNTNWLKKT